MTLMPVEVVFPLCRGLPDLSQEPELFIYQNGPVKTPGPWKRGRPKGSTNKRKRIIQRTDRISRVDSREVADRDDKPRTDGSMTSERDPAIHETLELERHDSSIGTVPFPISGVDPFDASPIHLMPYMLDLLHYYSTNAWKQFYSIEMVARCNPVAQYWLPLAFEDPALLHCLIGCACAYVSGYSSLSSGSLGSKHLFASVSIVNKRLVSGNGIASGGTLAVVAGMAMLEKGVGNHELWKVHMRGLRQIVSLCGGLEGLHCHPMILNKIYRADLYGSLDAVQSPYFDNPSLPVADTSYHGQFFSEGFNTIDMILRLDPPIRRCIHQLEAITSFWSAATASLSSNDQESESVQQKEFTGAEAASFRHLLTSSQYTLVIISSQQASQVSEFCCVALILYSLTVLNERPPSSAVGQQTANKLWNIFTEMTSESEDGNRNAPSILSEVPEDFILWSIFLATSILGTAQSDTKDRLLASLVDVKSKFYGDSCTWDQIKVRISRYLWVPSIHDGHMQRLIGEMANMRSAST